MREPEDTGHQGAHVFRRFGVRVLETCDGGENLAERNEQVCGRLSPDCERWRVVAGGRLVAARGFDVDEVLDQSGDDHAEHGADETGLDLLERREVDAHARQLRVEEFVEDGDEAERC